MRNAKRILGASLVTTALWACAMSGVASAQLDDDTRTLEIRVAEQKRISAKGVRSYSEGTPGIADVRVTKDQRSFVIVGKEVGTTSLLLIMRNGSQIQYSIRVIPAGAPKGLGARENIRLDLFFVLVDDIYGHAIGLNWPGNIGRTNVPSEARATVNITDGATTTNFQILANTFLPSLDLAQNKGWAKIYRQAALVTANGTEATFFAGGEFNTLAQNNLTVNAVDIQFGTRLTVLPRYDSKSGRIELEISADVSELDADRGSQGLPGRIISNIQTLVNLELGQSISLAGIRATTERRNKDGIPGLAIIPFVGALFGSHSRQKEDLQAYMFMVPSIVEPVSLSQRNRIDEAMRIFNEFKGGVDEVDLIERPRTERRTPPPRRRRKSKR